MRGGGSLVSEVTMTQTTHSTLGRKEVGLYGPNGGW